MMGLLAVFVYPEARTRTFRRNRRRLLAAGRRGVAAPLNTENHRFPVGIGARNVAHVKEREKLRL